MRVLQHNHGVVLDMSFDRSEVQCAAKFRSHLGSRHGTRRLVLPRDLFDFPMDAASLVIILHGELLRTFSSVVQEHFQRLAEAGRYLRSARLISPKDARKLRMIDDCCALVRHITTVSLCNASTSSVSSRAVF